MGGREAIRRPRVRPAAGEGEVALDKELCAIVALGIDVQGDKHVLDFKVGTSESAEYATQLLRRLVERGFGPKAKHRILSVIDGAHASLLVARECLLAVHQLKLGESLQRSLLSTNAIENTLRNWRQSTHGVNLSRRESDMATRWLASGLLWAQQGFHRVRGHE